LLLGMDFCTDNHVVIDFPKKTIVINADDEESATEVDLVNERQNIDSSIDSPVTRAINLGTAELPPTPQLDCIVNPSLFDLPTLQYNGRLPEEDLCPNQMTVKGMTLCNEVYGLFSWNAEDANNEGRAKRANNPNEYKNMNSAIAEGKYEHTDANVIRNVEVRSLTLENEGGIGRDGTLQGRSNEGITCSYDVEGLVKEEENSSLSLERLRIEENLSYDEKCKLLELIRKYQEYFVTRPGNFNMSEYRFKMQGGLPKSCNSRPIPFSLRREVREQIEETVKNSILEISHSPYVNPLTIIQRKNKPVRMI